MKRFLCLLALLAAPAAAQTPEPAWVAIRAGRLIDGLGEAPLTNATVLIEGERIRAVGTGLAIPAGAKILDLSRMTVLPGLIDCHTHITSAPGAASELRSSFLDAAILAPTYAKATLEAGFTTIRDLGAIAPGRFADIIAVEGNPLADITELERVRFVMKGGVTFKE